VEALETEDLDLDKSLQLFEESVQLYRHCDQQLQAAEKRIDVLRTRADGTLVPEPLTVPEEPPSSNGDNVSTFESHL
jgi:exodeoxyribonuclease VII small subunit